MYAIFERISEKKKQLTDLVEVKKSFQEILVSKKCLCRWPVRSKILKKEAMNHREQVQIEF